MSAGTPSLAIINEHEGKQMTAKAKYQRDMERWDNNELGNDEAFAAVAEGAAEALDEALNLQLISIRLQKGMRSNEHRTNRHGRPRATRTNWRNE